MGNATAFSFLYLHLIFLVITSLVLIFSFNGDAAFDRNPVAAETHDFDIIKVSSMLPDSVCDSSPEGRKLPSASSLKVVHKHGPCHKQHKTDSPQSPSQILTQDKSRVDSINARITALNSVKNTLTSTESVTLPAKSGLSLGVSNYVVTVGLGSPKRDLSLCFDTGSGLTWTQCEPCVRYCYQQHDPIFNPSESTSYANISCNTPTCNQLGGARCMGTNCIYGILYGDRSFTSGYLAKDTLTLTPTEIINDFYFGCGQNNQGLFGQIDGLIGLDKSKFSVISQTSMKYGNIFSYCLPSRSSGTGYLTFGNSAISNAIQYIPLGNSQEFYNIDIVGIYVGGQKLPISPTVFSGQESIIDSGTVITRLPSEAYSALKSSFRQQMSMYPTSNPFEILDTCYDFRRYTTVNVPRISFLFGGNTKIDLDVAGVFFLGSSSQTCLAFAGDANTIIFGNVQQKTLQVVYDVAGGKLGFGANGCV